MIKISRKHAFMRNGQKYFISSYNRAPERTWKNDYDDLQMKYLWDHNMIKYDDTRYFGEFEFYKYIQFTKKGKLWNDWYSCTLKEYLYYYVFKIPSIKIFYQKIMIKVFHKHYDWQDYVDVDIDDI